ncbi:MAG TPA: rhodanese-like domain-containing protein [Candidatus Limnocylindrales bacterium]|nr:rhodanese-like domain-containing protein [Candidatus Limnocylindrales bacterium]
MRVTQYRIEGLGHLSTLVVDEAEGVAAVVDPRRDVDIYLAAARTDDLRITHVVETHLHNDYVSGGRELAALTGATHVIGAGAKLAYEHRPLADGEAFDVGSIRFRVLATPGHTPEHVSYAVADTTRADEPFLVLTGGSMLVGAVGRTDLLGADNARPFAAAMYHSLHEVLLRHEDSVMVYPTHGAGSLCSAGTASTSWSTIGFERRHDPLLAPMEVELFARALLAGQPAFPRYFARMRPLNQAGPRLLGGAIPEIPALADTALDAALRRDALIVDARPPEAYAVAHAPGSMSIPAGGSFGTWLGWLVDVDRPIVLIVEHPADLDDLSRQALRIGYEATAGHVAGGFDAWRRAGRPVESGRSLDVDELARSLSAGGPDAPLVIDVRQLGEFERGHVPGALNIMAADLPSTLERLPADRPIATICASGFRSSVAASLLRSAGFARVAAVSGGIPDWEAHGYPLDYGAGTDGLDWPAPAEDAQVHEAHAH